MREIFSFSKLAVTVNKNRKLNSHKETVWVTERKQKATSFMQCKITESRGLRLTDQIKGQIE